MEKNKTVKPDYAVRKTGDNYGLYFRGRIVESGIFLTRATAEKFKRFAEHERRDRLSATK